jgi:hypothetical protein
VKEDGVRAVALDVHRDFCEVAIVAEGRVRSAGRIQTRPEALELFARSLAPDDWVALEVTGRAWAIAGILEGHVARVIVVSPTDTGIRQARAKDRSSRCPHAGQALWAGELDGVWTPDERVRVMRQPLGAPRSAGARALAREERDPRGVDALPEGPPARLGPLRDQGPGVGWPTSSWRCASARPSTPACARSTSSTPDARASHLSLALTLARRQFQPASVRDSGRQLLPCLSVFIHGRFRRF